MKRLKLCKEFCKQNFNIKLVFNSFKVKNYFSYKDPIPNNLKSFLIYKFTCASCSSSYIGETCRHFKTRIEGHIKKDNKSHIFKHLHSNATCFDSYNFLCFKINDKAGSKFDLKVKEALHINWRKPFCYSFCSPCSFLSFFVCLLFFFAVVFWIFLLSIVFIISTLIIGIFYCLNYLLLLLHLFITHLVIDFILIM